MSGTSAARRAPTGGAGKPASSPAVARPAPPLGHRPESARYGWQVGAFGVAFFVLALFYVWTRTEVVKATYGLARVQKQIEVERQYNQKLRLEILTLKAPDRLAAVAVQRLDMQPPGEGQVVVVE